MASNSPNVASFHPKSGSATAKTKRPAHPSFERPRSPPKSIKMDRSVSPTKDEELTDRLEKVPEYIDPSSLSSFDDFETISSNNQKSEDSEPAPIPARSPRRKTKRASAKKSPRSQGQSEKVNAQGVGQSDDQSSIARRMSSSSGSPHKSKPLAIIPENTTASNMDTQYSPTSTGPNHPEQTNTQNDMHQNQEHEHSQFHSIYQQAPIRAPFSSILLGSSSSGSSSSSQSYHSAETAVAGNSSSQGSTRATLRRKPQEAPVMGAGNNFKDPFFYNMFLDFKKGIEDMTKENEEKEKEKEKEKKKTETEAVAEAEVKDQGKPTSDGSSSAVASHSVEKPLPKLPLAAHNEDNRMDIDGKE